LVSTFKAALGDGFFDKTLPPGIEALEAQKLAAAAVVKNSRYMLMSVVMATIATTITAAGLVFQYHQPCQSPSLSWAKRRAIASNDRAAIILLWWLGAFDLPLTVARWWSGGHNVR
jgi:hypothetical protein